MRHNHRQYYLVVVAALACSATGCASHFEVHRAKLAENGMTLLIDPEAVSVPTHASKRVPVYWKDYGSRSTSGASTPHRPYEIIGRARGVVGVGMQFESYLDEQFRRAAAALDGDAIIDAKKGPWIPKPPGNEYTGRIIKWKQPTTSASE